MVRSNAFAMLGAPGSHAMTQCARNRFLRAGHEGRSIRKNDPAGVAHVGFDAMMRGDGPAVSGWRNKRQSAIANVTPAAAASRMNVVGVNE